MSVLARIKELSGGEQGKQEAPFKGPKFTDAGPASEAEEMMKANPIPGQSLTQDPESKLPYETPPEFTDLQEFIDEVFLRLSDPEQIESVFDVMGSGIPLEHIAQKLLMKSFQNGEITPDMLLLAIEPTIYILIALATYGSVEVTLYPEDDMMDPADGEGEDPYKRASRDMLAEEDKDDNGSITVDEVQAPTTVPKSLLARSKKAVEQVRGGK